MKQSLKKLFFRPVSNHRGGAALILIFTAVTVIGWAWYNDVPGAFDNMVLASYQLGEGNPTNEQTTATLGFLTATVDTATHIGPGGLANNLLYLPQRTMINVSTQIGSAPIPTAQSTIHSGQSGNCYIKIDPTTVVNPGDLLTAKLFLPELFAKKAGRVDCILGSTGIDIGLNLQTREAAFRIPSDTTADSLTLMCNVIATDGGGDICTPSVKMFIPHYIKDKHCASWGVGGPEIASVRGQTWQRCESFNNITWLGARSYCDGLDLGGYTDWRLPTAEEMKSLVMCGNKTPYPLPMGCRCDLCNGCYGNGDESCGSFAVPAIDKRLKTMAALNSWTSTTFHHDYYNETMAYRVSLDDGHDNYEKIYGRPQGMVRCVRP